LVICGIQQSFLHNAPKDQKQSFTTAMFAHPKQIGLFLPVIFPAAARPRLLGEG
jgi:hypothetical protein